MVLLSLLSLGLDLLLVLNKDIVVVMVCFLGLFENCFLGFLGLLNVRFFDVKGIKESKDVFECFGVGDDSLVNVVLLVFFIYFFGEFSISGMWFE